MSLNRRFCESTEHVWESRSERHSVGRDKILKLRNSTSAHGSPNIAALSDELQCENERELRNRISDLRESVHSKQTDLSSLAAPVIAITNEAIRRVLGVNLYDVQILASSSMIRGAVAEMQTGEGKTMAAVPAAIYGGIRGGGVHIATPNPYLAERDYSSLKEVYEALGISVGLLTCDGDNSLAKSKSYNCDITYGPGHEFGFDYLRDQLILKNRSLLPRGQQLLTTLEGGDFEKPVQRRGLRYAIVDEIDNVLVDDASSPQVLSEFQPGVASDSAAVNLAKRCAQHLHRNQHYLERSSGYIGLTDEGIRKVHSQEIPIPVEQLLRPWTKVLPLHPVPRSYVPLLMLQAHSLPLAQRICCFFQ
ncbi:MAG: DEAD/DEAH box helicase [Planctomycetota bacterium]